MPNKRTERYLGCETVDSVDFNEAVATGRTFPLRFLSEMECRTGCPIERFFGFTPRTVVGDLKAHTPELEPRCVKILVHSSRFAGYYYIDKSYSAISNTNAEDKHIKDNRVDC